MPRQLHIDASLGVAGDMLLAALVDAGTPVSEVDAAIAAVLPGARIAFAEERRRGMRAVRARVAPPPGHPSPGADAHGDRWEQIRDRLRGAGLPPVVRDRAVAVFERLAAAEGRVHGIPADDVRFHEVGAWDSICDIVGVVAAVEALGPSRITSTPVAVGSGYAETQHGTLPVPAPAVLELLRTAQAPMRAGPAAFESCTPTGAALLCEYVDQWARAPDLVVDRIGIGAGTADPGSHPNVVRVILGEPVPAATEDPLADPVAAAVPSGATPSAAMVLLETNVDDLDPRAWPGVLSQLLDSGAVDAWLTPITMKKGRPAHTLSVLVPPEAHRQVARRILQLTPAIGMRVRAVSRLTAERTLAEVLVLGRSVRVKVASFEGTVVNVQPEWEDVATLARDLGMPVKQVLAAAHGAATHLWQQSPNSQR